MRSVTVAKNVERDLPVHKLYATMLKYMMVLGTLSVLNVIEGTQISPLLMNNTTESTEIHAIGPLTVFSVQRNLQKTVILNNT